jgi:hypothetical protein
MYDTRNGIHIGLTAILGWLAFYFDYTRNVFSTEEVFAYMARFGSEHAWSVLFLAAANIGAIGVFSHNPPARLGSVLVVATAHGIFAGCLIMSNASVWSGTYAIIAGMGYYLAYRFTRAV